MISPLLLLDTEAIRKQLIRSMVSPQSSIIIVTPFLQDVDIEAGRTLAGLLRSQVTASTEVELFTTPPSGKGGEFLRKYQLLEVFRALGLKIYLNDKLHAKAFCFNNDGRLFVSLVGSANLTTAGLKQNLELAVFSARRQFYHSTIALVRKFVRDRHTDEYLAWKLRNALTIKANMKGIP